MTIELDDTEAQKTLNRLNFVLSDAEVRKVTVQSLNRALRGARTEISRAIRSDYRVKSSAIKDAMTLKRANSAQKIPGATIEIAQKLLPLSQFGRLNQTARGASVTIRRGQRQTIEGGFVLDSLGGEAFKREGGARLPIKKLFGPSVRQLAPPAIKVAQPEVAKRLDDQIERNLNRAIRKAVK